MKIGEKVHFDESRQKIIVENTYDVAPTLDRAQQLRSLKLDGIGESKLVGTIPMFLIQEWCKEAGIKWSDTHARKEVVKKKILSGEFDKLRVWKGTY
jgi:hypothetical protein